MKRQRSRNRGGGGGPSGGNKPQHNVNRAFDSNGPDNVKIRGHAQHVFEKYQQLARDAFSGGDRVVAENYLQHADHYFRVLRTLQPQRPASEILGRDVFASGLDIDFEDEGGESFEEGGEAGGDPGDAGGGEMSRSEARSDGNRNDGGRNDGNRNDGGRREERYDNRRGAEDRFEPRRDAQDARGDFRREDRFEPRREGQEARGDGRRNEERVEPRRDSQEPRDARPAARPENRPENRPDNRAEPRRFEGRRDRDGRGDYRDDRQGRGEEPRRYETAAPDRGAEPPPSDAGMPRNNADSSPVTQAGGSGGETSSVLRSHDGEVSEAPAFLQSAQMVDEGGEARRPRTRRRRPRALPGEEGADAPEKDTAEQA